MNESGREGLQGIENYKNMKLTAKQIREIWGDDGPYSEVSIKIQTRILDDSVSRIFIEVDANINPLTFKVVKKMRILFKDDIIIQHLLDNARFVGQSYGYTVCAYTKEYEGVDDLKKAQLPLEYTRDAIIKMHKYVMELYGLDEKQNRFN